MMISNSEIPTAFSAEEAFVQQAMRSFILRERIPDALPAGLDWDRVGQVVSINNIGPIVHSLFSRQGLPLRDMAAWGKTRQLLLFSNMKKLDIAARLFDLFEEEGIRSVGLRGLTLAHSYYPDPGLRPMKDLDILVGISDRERIADVMSSRGHRAAKNLRTQMVYLIDGVEVELHLSLLTTKRYRDVLDAETLLGSRSRAPVGRGFIYRLSAEHELLELVAHAYVHHELQGFVRMLDIALVMQDPSIDWTAVARWCGSRRVTNMYLFTLSFVASLFGLDQARVGGYYDRRLPASAVRMFESYRKPYFGGDTIGHYLARKRSLLYAAEHPSVKMRQILRLFSSSTVRDIIRLSRKEATPTGGSS